MDSSQTTTEPINPLTGDLVTVSVVRRTHPLEVREDVEARLVKPGLVIVPAKLDDQLKGRARYNLAHTPTGLGVSMRMCGVHVQVAAELAAAIPVDWMTPDRDDIVAAIKRTDLLDQLRPISPCRSWCDGDGPEPPSYSVRCTTCDWEWDDEYDEGPLSLEDAKRLAEDHECEPWIEIQSPVTGKWHEKWSLRDAEDKAVSPAKEA